jgi:hypothetical protein
MRHLLPVISALALACGASGPTVGQKCATTWQVRCGFTQEGVQDAVICQETGDTWVTSSVNPCEQSCAEGEGNTVTCGDSRYSWWRSDCVDGATACSLGTTSAMHCAGGKWVTTTCATNAKCQLNEAGLAVCR